MTTLFGACLSAPGAKPDQYHATCPREFTDQWGVRHVCGCPAHERDDAETPNEIRGNGSAMRENGGTNQQCPEPALTDPGRRPHPAKEL